MARLAGKRERRYSPSSASTGLVDELVEEVLEEESVPLEEESVPLEEVSSGAGVGVAAAEASLVVSVPEEVPRSWLYSSKVTSTTSA